jgi:hypothetical protein
MGAEPRNGYERLVMEISRINYDPSHKNNITSARHSGRFLRLSIASAQIDFAEHFYGAAVELIDVRYTP